MTGDLTIQQARLVLPDRAVVGDLVIRDGTIAAIGPSLTDTAGEVIDGRGLVVLPGAMDAQVHFRDPGATHKEDLASGSRAAAAGGVTAFLDMPNVFPTTTTVAALDDKLAHAAEVCAVHYGFFIGATGDNLDELLAAERTCGIKIFMGASTGSLLVSDPDVLDQIFGAANKLIAVHAEDQARLQERYALYDGTTDPADHPKIRDVSTALSATQLATRLAAKHGTRLHVLHVTSEEEADLLAGRRRDRVSAEVCIQHLVLDAETAYARLGTRAQCNPPVRAARHREALWRHLKDGTFDLVATDHAPHTAEEKARPYPTSPSGVPGVEWMLPLLLDRVNRGLCTLNEVARWVCEGPARTYAVPRKGRLEVGYDGDVVIVDMNERRVISSDKVYTRAGWSPYDGWTVQGWPVLTAVLGVPVYRDGAIVEGVRGRELSFATGPASLSFTA